MFPLCYFTAISGTLCIIELSYIACNLFEFIKRPILYFGKHSLYLLFVHAMDYLYTNYWNSSNLFHASIKRVLLDVIVFFALMKCVNIFHGFKNSKLLSSGIKNEST